MEDLKLDYYYGAEADQFSFYRIPKVLFTDARFKSISIGAKLLYGLMLDRMSLSVMNKWFDYKNRVYIYFTMEDAMKFLDCGHNKAVKLFSELDTVKGIGLIERRKQGQGRPTIIYVKNFISLVSEDRNTTNKVNDFSWGMSGKNEKLKTFENGKCKNKFENNGQADKGPELMKNKPEPTIEYITEETVTSLISAQENKAPFKFVETDFRKEEDMTSEYSLSNNGASGNHMCGLPLMQSQDCRKEEANYININNTDSSYNNLSIHQSCSSHISKEKIEFYRRTIKDNFCYDGLIDHYGVARDKLDFIVEIALEIICSSGERYRIEGRYVPEELVRSRILKLNMFHILYVMDSLDKVRNEVRNPKNYILSTLYNSLSDSYYYSFLNDKQVV